MEGTDAATAAALTDTGKIVVLSRDDVINVDDLPRELLAVPEWGGHVWVRGLTGSERGEWDAGLQSTVAQYDGSGKRQVTQEFSPEQMRVSLCTKVLINEDGSRMFTEEERAIVGGKSSAGLQRVYDAGKRLSGMDREAVADAVKGSSETQEDEAA